MEKFIDSLTMAAKSGNVKDIVVYGYASPDGPYPNNNNLSLKRCDTVAGYISRHAGLPVAEIRRVPCGVAWETLRRLVKESAVVPERDKVLKVLNEFLPEACTERAKSDQCISRLIAIDEGITYNWLVDNIFPLLRFSLAVFTGNKDEIHPSESISEYIDSRHDSLGSVITDSLSRDDEPDESDLNTREQSDTINVSPEYVVERQRLAIKTNLLYYAALLPNLEVEWMINKNWSVALEGDLAWWGKYSKEKSYRLAVVSPEVKRWIRPRTAWHGFYIGAFVGAGLYDFEKPKRGYRGEGVMGGLSVGFMWPVSRRLSLEAALGAGYLYTRYKEYVPLDGHHVYLRTKDLHYFGPLKVKFSLVWRLWDVKKPRKADADNLVMNQYEK